MHLADESRSFVHLKILSFEQKYNFDNNLGLYTLINIFECGKKSIYALDRFIVCAAWSLESFVETKM